ncbi:DUF2768 domain-containing protein [Tenuibacillus multivorans]|uniref:DUF2768 domain-containing protein n=1 Tax=Tenuibacillus multivorans TaxID=237069 RepID=A0A1H0CVJ0_9BACI|nr:DUF2768 domain-containing protein [Tenuibacillus multivorans]GEL76148.1 hypothetical protein TMU01_03830 [Tenuibacillus multivorans]SDN61875.1 Protein of unknown function [Tenuibacillus multivorans]
MSEGMLRMYISFAGMGALILSALLILFARHKLKGVIRFVVSLLAYGLLVIGGFIIMFIVLSGPTG